MVGRPCLDETLASWQQSDSQGTTGEQPDVGDVTVSSLAWRSTSSRPFTTFYPSRIFTPDPFLVLKRCLFFPKTRQLSVIMLPLTCLNPVMRVTPYLFR